MGLSSVKIAVQVKLQVARRLKDADSSGGATKMQEMGPNLR